MHKQAFFYRNINKKWFNLHRAVLTFDRFEICFVPDRIWICFLHVSFRLSSCRSRSGPKAAHMTIVYLDPSPDNTFGLK